MAKKITFNEVIGSTNLIYEVVETAYDVEFIQHCTKCIFHESDERPGYSKCRAVTSALSTNPHDLFIKTENMNYSESIQSDNNELYQTTHYFFTDETDAMNSYIWKVHEKQCLNNQMIKRLEDMIEDYYRKNDNMCQSVDYWKKIYGWK